MANREGDEGEGGQQRPWYNADETLEITIDARRRRPVREGR